MALGMFAEKQVASKCGDALVVEHMDVFQHLFGLGAKTVERSGIDLVEVVVEGVAVKVLERSVAYGCCVDKDYHVLKSIFRHNAIPSVVVSYLLCFPQNYNFFLNRLSFSEEMCTNTLQGEAMGLLHRYFLYSES